MKTAHGARSSNDSLRPRVREVSRASFMGIISVNSDSLENKVCKPTLGLMQIRLDI